MNRSTKDELISSVIRHLAEGDDPDDIVLDICNSYGYEWSQAEKLVNQVQIDCSSSIAKKQLPLMYISAFFILAAGLALIGIGLYSILESIITHEGLFPPNIYTYMMPRIDKSNFSFSAFLPAIYPYVKWFLSLVISPFSMIVFGVTMVLGSFFGMRDIWSNILKI